MEGERQKYEIGEGEAEPGNSCCASWVRPLEGLGALLPGALEAPSARTVLCATSH